MGRRRFSQRSGLESAEDQLSKMALVMGRALAKKDGLLIKIKDRVIKVKEKIKEKLFVGVHAKELVNEIQKIVHETSRDLGVEVVGGFDRAIEMIAFSIPFIPDSYIMAFLYSALVLLGVLDLKERRESKKDREKRIRELFEKVKKKRLEKE